MDRFLMLKEVSSGYGESLIVDRVSLGVDQGAVVSIVGANGSGKSTLLRTVVGLIKPFSGKISFNDTDITGLEVERISRMGVGYVPQVNNVFPNISVRENLRIGGYFLSKEEFGRKERNVLSLFSELANYISTRVEKLSGGERQMVAIARCLMGSPRLLLLDEPTAALAPIAATKVLEKIRAIRETGTTVVLVEQNAKKAIRLSDYVYVMFSGRILAEGTREKIEADGDLGRRFLGLRPSGAGQEAAKA